MFTLVPHFFQDKIKKSWLKKNIKYDKTTLRLFTSKEERFLFVTDLELVFFRVKILLKKRAFG